MKTTLNIFFNIIHRRIAFQLYVYFFCWFVNFIS